MPLRPFPFPLSIGTDIVHVNRIRAVLSKAQGSPDHLDRFLRRFLTPREHDAFRSQYNVTAQLKDAELDVVSRHLAGRWAAKEAAIKAVTWRRLSFHDVVIARSRDRGTIAAIILDETTSLSQRDGHGSLGAENLRRANDANTASTADDHPHADHESLTASSSQSGPSSLSEDSSHLPDLSDAQDGDAVSVSEESEFLDGDIWRDLHGQIARISISHDGEYATAVCLAAEEPRAGDVGGEAAAREPI